MRPEISKHIMGGHQLWFWANYLAADGDWWRWPSFTPYEMRCRKTGRLQVSPAFMDDLQIIRTAADFPFPVTSGYRSPAHNAAISHTRALDGPHPDAQAVDIALSRNDAFTVLRLTMNNGFTGLGIKQHGDSRYLHLDQWWKRAKGTLWTYNEE